MRRPEASDSTYFCALHNKSAICPIPRQSYNTFCRLGPVIATEATGTYVAVSPLNIVANTAGAQRMRLSEFKKAGHWPTLLAAFLYFDIGFMAWVSLGPLMVYISKGMEFSVDEKFTLVAIPVLSGALLRIPMGLLSDAIGAKLTGIIAQIVVMAACAFALFFGLSSKLAIELFGVVLGIGGASFAVALPQASRWYPPQYQGVVMGIAGAGNMGVVIDTMLAPTIAEHFGWQAVFGFLLIPMVLILAFYTIAAKDAPVARRPVSLAAYGK